ncbi:type VII secretion-associated serine protease mycosin [Tsukamurella sp. 8F]|uniref:type VII secretion-associated serine protease mycosin n=1 Tax=unclassified Tsukamurella TaxID=2633480 RepID=UPI0023B9F84B|nr:MULTISPECIES: type VII secretion-associated serine protease mycosin [unclassified Tsukamurella]MDF0531138.1 type VII secretion-associated serine protease mycosin [Tsukamurella sp. 8J]MDF0588384.1 type VII secretion-associated serine protease mycosin [Tsukamurella sp. 8F]
MPAAGRRAAAVTVVAVAVIAVGAGPAAAIAPPIVDPQATPHDSTPAPEQPMQKRSVCTPLRLAPKSDPASVPPAQAFMRLPQLWKVAGRGSGVTVAMIDTGVNKNSRFPHLSAGGDYVADGDGLADCDAHGSIVASIINAAPSSSDGVVGIAPDANLISIRQSSGAYQPVNGDSSDSRAGDVASLARAVVHAAARGAKVINISVVACTPVNKPVDQRALGAAVRWASVVKDALVIAAAGNIDENNCAANPDIDPTTPKDARNWGGVSTVSTPSWFSDYVLSVGTVDTKGVPATKVTAAGPWVSVAAPATPNTVAAVGASGHVVNEAMGSDQKWQPLFGTSFSAAEVTGLAAVLRSRFPSLTAHQIALRITQTAHNPAGGVDNEIGYGVIDPIAAATFDVPTGDPKPVEHLSRPLVLPPPPPPPDRRPFYTAVIGTAVVAGVGLAAGIAVSILNRRRKGRR